MLKTSHDKNEKIYLRKKITYSKLSRDIFIFCRLCLYICPSFFAFLSGLIVLYNRYNAAPGYEHMALLPFSYGILYLIFPSMSRYIVSHIGMLIMNIIMLIRYVIMPLVIAISGSYGGFGQNPDSNTVRLAIFIMLYEMLVVFIVVAVFAKSIYKDKKTKKYDFSHVPLNSKIVILCLIAVAIGVIARYPEVLERYHFFVIRKEFKARVEIQALFKGLIELLSEWAKYFIYIIMIDKFKVRYDRTGKIKYVWLSYLVSLPIVMFFINTSRYSIVVPSIVIITLMNILYPNYKTITITMISLIMLFSVGSLTLYKYFGVNSSLSTAKITLEVLAERFQMYFSGPRNIAMAIETKHIFSNDITINTFFNDFLGSIPGISKLVNRLDRTNTYFNYRVLGFGDNTSQIIPMSGQGYIFFGIIGAPIFTALSTYIMMRFDSRASREARIDYRYIFTWGAIWLGAAMMYNVQIEEAFFMNYFLPMYIIFYFNRRIVLKKRDD